MFRKEQVNGIPKHWTVQPKVAGFQAWFDEIRSKLPFACVLCSFYNLCRNGLWVITVSIRQFVNNLLPLRISSDQPMITSCCGIPELFLEGKYQQGKRHWNQRQGHPMIHFFRSPKSPWAEWDWRNSRHCKRTQSGANCWDGLSNDGDAVGHFNWNLHKITMYFCFKYRRWAEYGLGCCGRKSNEQNLWTECGFILN